jgi:hypothetical protein
VLCADANEGLPVVAAEVALTCESLGRRLISQLTIRPSDLDEHRVLDLILYDAWENLWGVEFATRQVQFESGLQGTYESAWRWALLLTKADRAARFASIVQSNRR